MSNREFRTHRLWVKGDFGGAVLDDVERAISRERQRLGHRRQNEQKSRKNLAKIGVERIDSAG